MSKKNIFASILAIFGVIFFGFMIFGHHLNPVKDKGTQQNLDQIWSEIHLRSPLNLQTDSSVFFVSASILAELSEKKEINITEYEYSSDEPKTSTLFIKSGGIWWVKESVYSEREISQEEKEIIKRAHDAIFK